MKKLLEKNVRVVAGVHSLKRADPLIAMGAEVVQYDLKNPESVEAALKGADKLFLLIHFSKDLIEDTRVLAQAAKKVGVQHIVKLGGLGVDTRKHLPAIWHKGAEEAIRETGVAYTFLQPTNFLSNITLWNGHTIKGQNTLYGATGDGKVCLYERYKCTNSCSLDGLIPLISPMPPVELSPSQVMKTKSML